MYYPQNICENEQLKYLLLSSLLTLLVMIIIIFLFYSRDESESVKIEAVIPYLINEEKIFIPRQHQYRPQYDLAEKAREAFEIVYKEKDQRDLANDWEKAKRKEILIQQFLAETNRDLCK